MRKIIIEIETDSAESIGVLKQDLEQEIECCWNSFDMESMKVFEIIGTNIVEKGSEAE